MSNIDLRGIKRGHCDSCDCEEYMYNVENGPQCFYCSCPPTRHEKLATEHSANENVENSVNCSPTIDSSIVNESISFDVNISKDGLVEMFAAENHLKLLDLETLLPAKLPNDVEAAMRKKKFKSTHRCKIIRAIADRCFSADVKTSVVDMVADTAVCRWSPLKSEYGHRSKALAMQIKKRMSKLKSSGESVPAQKEDIISSHDANLSLMVEEMQEILPSEVRLKNCLNAVRQIRRKKAGMMPAGEHLKIYPALKNQDLLLWEFCSVINISAENLVSRWICGLEALENYLEGSNNAIPESCFSEDMKTVHILNILPAVLPSGKKTKEANKFVLELFPERTTIKDTIPKATDPPRLIGIGNISLPSMCLICYVDKTPLFTEQGVKALLMLIAAYWVFDIQFCPEARPSFLFLSLLLLGEKFSSPWIIKTPSVTNLLKQLNL